MSYDDFVRIVNEEVSLNEKRYILESIAKSPQRFLGIFRPSKPKTKIVQYLLQSREIKMGKALERLLREILISKGFVTLDRRIYDSGGARLDIDLLFEDSDRRYIVEQKIRNDHDSSKKRGQIENFRSKLSHIKEAYQDEKETIAIMYFIDPGQCKNKSYYHSELNRIADELQIQAYLMYGRELFEYLKIQEMWDTMINWLVMWKETLPDFPDVDFDANPSHTFEEVKHIDISTWAKIINKDELWKEGLITSIFTKGIVLNMVADYFSNSGEKRRLYISEELKKRIREYYEFGTR